MAFDKLFRNKDTDYLDAEPPEDVRKAPQEAQEPVVIDPRDQSTRYRVEIATSRIRTGYYDYRAEYVIFDTHQSNKEVKRGNADQDDVGSAEEYAISAATYWIKEQHEINNGPRKRTVWLGDNGQPR